MISDGGSGHGDRQGVGEWEGEGWSAFGRVTAASGQGQGRKKKPQV